DAYFFSGAIDEISIYNRALSSNEITAIYAVGGAGKCATLAALSIVGISQSQAVTLGANVTLSVGAQGAPPLTYQWRHDGYDIAGANGTNLTLPSVMAAAAGDYAV